MSSPVKTTSTGSACPPLHFHLAPSEAGANSCSFATIICEVWNAALEWLASILSCCKTAPERPTFSPAQAGETTPTIRSAPAIVLPSKRTLTVRKLEMVDKTATKVGQLMEQWKDIAATKGAKTREKEKVDVFYASEVLSDGLAVDIRIRRDDFKGYTFLACEDDNAEPTIQAIALVVDYNDNEIHLKTLVTHPNNIRNPVNYREPNRVEGAGSALINYIKKEAEETRRPIALCPNPSAVSFYEKHGFEGDGLMTFTPSSIGQK